MKKVIMMLCCGILLLFGVSSCSLDADDSNFEFTFLQVVRAEFPETFQLNEVHQVEVVVTIPNGCTFFERFDVDNPETTTRVVSAVGAILKDETCTQVVQEVTVSFDFRVDFTEPYLFRFYSGEDESGNPQFIEYIVPVAE